MDDQPQTALTPSELNRGDRVSHIIMGAGTVIAANLVSIIVEYDRDKTRGNYDKKWFQVYPNYLYRLKVKLVNDG